MGLGWSLLEGSEEARKEMGTELPEHLLCTRRGPSTDRLWPLRTAFPLCKSGTWARILASLVLHFQSE